MQPTEYQQYENDFPAEAAGVARAQAGGDPGEIRSAWRVLHEARRSRAHDHGDHALCTIATAGPRAGQCVEVEQ